MSYPNDNQEAQRTCVLLLDKEHTLVETDMPDVRTRNAATVLVEQLLPEAAQPQTVSQLSKLVATQAAI